MIIMSTSTACLSLDTSSAWLWHFVLIHYNGWRCCRFDRHFHHRYRDKNQHSYNNSFIVIARLKTTTCMNGNLQPGNFHSQRFHTSLWDILNMNTLLVMVTSLPVSAGKMFVSVSLNLKMKKDLTVFLLRILQIMFHGLSTYWYMTD